MDRACPRTATAARTVIRHAIKAGSENITAPTTGAQMLNDVSLYVWTLFEKYQLIFGIVIPSAIAAPCLNMLDRFKNWGGARAVTVASYALVIFAVFWMGFLAWRDEHAARIAIEQRANDPVIRLKDEISKLPKDVDGLKPGDLWNNGGSIAVVQ
ncbi:hypothetical protein [Methylobacterium brachiatum]|uniref:hypothetical protein n=1 Tax=Methylobacterium brachiatum TaxID=269660 RepID=UPI0013CF2C61|nr:hypothetical protein [Methylobacterium brachiatum]